MDEVVRQMDVDNDGKLSQLELKSGIAAKLGLYLSAAETIFLFRYLAQDDSYANLDIFKMAINFYKPKHVVA